jgi:hypothetical protein
MLEALGAAHLYEGEQGGREVERGRATGVKRGVRRREREREGEGGGGEREKERERKREKEKER